MITPLSICQHLTQMTFSHSNRQRIRYKYLGSMRWSLRCHVFTAVSHRLNAKRTSYCFLIITECFVIHLLEIKTIQSSSTLANQINGIIMFLRREKITDSKTATHKIFNRLQNYNFQRKKKKKNHFKRWDNCYLYILNIVGWR